jgi:hypothetical protein
MHPGMVMNMILYKPSGQDVVILTKLKKASKMVFLYLILKTEFFIILNLQKPNTILMKTESIFAAVPWEEPAP